MVWHRVSNFLGAAGREPVAALGTILRACRPCAGYFEVLRANPDAGARQNRAMLWNSLLEDVLAVLRDGRTADELAAHEASMRQLLTSMATTGHQRDAPVRATTAAVGDRWTTLILEVLSPGRMRHSELRRIIDLVSAEQEISQRVLTLKLRALERDGMVLRTVTPGAPPRVDYQLTARGRELHELI
jgi:DNA-binding HxlR family transcriptional regulator